ncbi:nuclear transport factor 2 family protein [Nocardia macrotermitis]|uniref:SnoaL-like domain-containing protein n=1 Tax=Nocardia macrotermitis TaxID=2585198 RepID=A0A7K0D5F7_9NOCA|nr:nuclear transport factor 2 family protein [Nocardia macrotermitis]MQY20968.1 hypothetical protein [Nocardia macrotermitis]
MPAANLDRAELEEFWAGWLEANREAERNKDWKHLADWYAPDANYGWMVTPDDHFMATDREEIRAIALGTEMAGLDGWHYDYMATVMDEVNGMIVGFWRQGSGVTDDNGDELTIEGIGGSWFGIERREQQAGSASLQFAWQRDWFDFNSMVHTFTAVAKSGKATEGLLGRLTLEGRQPGHYRKGDLPFPVWPQPVERGDFIAQTAL